MHRKPGKAVLVRDSDKDARALVFMLERIRGKSLAAIAAEYNCHPNTVFNYLERARQRGLILDEARSLISSKLLPMALAVYEAHLQAGSLDAAHDIVYGIGALEKNSTVKHEADPGETLDTFREKLAEAKKTITVTVSPMPVQEGHINNEPKHLPPGGLPDGDDQDLEDA